MKKQLLLSTTELFCFLLFLDFEVLGFAVVFGGGCCYCCWVFVFWLVGWLLGSLALEL